VFLCENKTQQYLWEVPMSRKVSLILMVIAAVWTVWADNLIINGDFEQLPGGTGWSVWWGGNSNRYVTDPLNPANHCAGVWWHDDGIFQTIPIGQGKYEFGGKIMTTQGMVNRNGVIRASFGPSEVDLAIVPGDAVNTWYFKSGIIDNSSIPYATTLTLNLMMANTGTPPSGIVFYDDIYLGPVGISKQAKFPHPYNGEIVAPSTNVLRWTNPLPYNPAESIHSTVYLEKDDGDPNFQSAPIVVGLTTNSVNLSSLGIFLQPSTKYYWRVNSTDPNNGVPQLTQGPIWTFTTLDDDPPVVDAGSNKYLWLSMADGDGDPTKVTFMLDGTLTDDGKSPVSLLWELIYSEQDPATVVNIATPTQVDSVVTINGTGFYRFRLSADDAYAHAEDIVEVIVYGSACEAAQGDPTDHYHTYPYIGDVNNDCLVNMADFAILAATWLDCLSDKLGCTP